MLLHIFSKAVLSVFMELHKSRSFYLYTVLGAKGGGGGKQTTLALSEDLTGRIY